MSGSHLNRHDSLEVLPQKHVLHERVVELRPRLEEGASFGSLKRVRRHLLLFLAVSIAAPATLGGRRDGPGAGEPAYTAVGEETFRQQQRSLLLHLPSLGAWHGSHAYACARWRDDLMSGTLYQRQTETYIRLKL